MTYIGDANDDATILHDAGIFFQSYFAATDADEVAAVDSEFGLHTFPQYWPLGQQTSGLIQVHDLLAPVDFEMSVVFLQRLSVIAGAFLSNRDDVRGFPEDPFRERVMPAWGAFTPDRDDKWNTDVSTAGLFVYAMAALAHRVAERPDRYPQLLRDQAVRMITAAIETYEAFRPELHLVVGDPYAYYILPERYSTLVCADGNKECENYRAAAGKPMAYNESLSMIKALSELAPAADSNLYRASADATPARLQLATEEMPLVVAKTIAYRVADLHPRTLSDATPYYEWDYEGGGGPEDIHHAQFDLGCLAVVLEGQLRLNELLERAGRAERVPLTPSTFERMANTFLRIVWRNNQLTGKIDGSEGEGNTNECAGWVPLAQFDPLVWTRARDTTFNASLPGLRVDNHGALLRYRKFNAMKYLTNFAGQNWLITPAALAVGEQPPRSIRDQKWLLILSGVVLANQRGDSSGAWNHQTVSFIPDMAGPDDPTATSGPLNWAITRYGIPRPPGTVGQQYLVRFSVEEWSPFVSLGSVFDQGPAVNAGFAVDDWRPNHFESGTDVLTNETVNNIFTGVNADLAVNDTDAWIYRLGYNITLIGRIVFIAPAIEWAPPQRPTVQPIKTS
ncbi:MAG: hypothetical protein WAU69_06780 [Solirubrobacteraceae bacterium]